MGGGRVREVRLEAEDVNRASARLEGVEEALLQYSVHKELRAVFLAPAHVDTVVLAWVGRGGGTLNAKTALLDDKVVFLAVRAIEVDVNRNLELLVVGLVEQVDVAHDAHHALALCTELVDVNVGALVVHHGVALEQHHHLVAGLAIDDVVGQLLVIGDGTVIYAKIAKLHVGIVREDTDVDRVFLYHGVGLREAHRTRQDAVDIELQETVAALGTDHEGDLVVHARGELGAHLRASGGADERLLRGHLEAHAASHAVEDDAVTVRDVVAHQLHLIGRSRACGIGGERLEADVDARTVGKTEGIARPAVGSPIEARELGGDVAILPCGRIRLGARTSRCGELQLQASRGLDDIDATLLHLDEERIGDHAALEAHLDGALVEKAVGVCLQRARHADSLCLDAVTVNGHGGWCRGRVVCHEVEGHLLVLPSLDGWLQVVVGEDGAVGGNNLRTDVWGVGRTPQNIQIYAVGAERERRARLHLRHHLYGVTAIVKPRHGEVEAAVCGAASGDGLCVALLAVDIEGHHLGARATDGERYADGLVVTIATLRHALGDVEGRREGERDCLD